MGRLQANRSAVRTDYLTANQEVSTSQYLVAIQVNYYPHWSSIINYLTRRITGWNGAFHRRCDSHDVGLLCKRRNWESRQISGRLPVHLVSVF